MAHNNFSFDEQLRIFKALSPTISECKTKYIESYSLFDLLREDSQRAISMYQPMREIQLWGMIKRYYEKGLTVEETIEYAKISLKQTNDRLIKNINTTMTTEESQ